MQFLRVGPAARTALAFLLALGVLLVPATVASAARQETGTDRLLDPAAGWHGRAIQQSHDHNALRTASPSTPPGWSAGPVSLGTGSHRPTGSQRVREVQRRLRRLGYGVGSVDGIYGPRTRDAVAWFQRKHGLPLDGRAMLATVRHLRERTGETPRVQRPPAPPSAEAPTPPSSPATSSAPPVVTALNATEDPVPPQSWTTVALALGVVGLMLLVFGYLIDRRRRRVAAGPAAPVVLAAQAGSRHADQAAASPSRGARALGYVRLARGASSASFHAQAAAIETGCLARGMTLVSLVSDVETDRQEDGQPPALTFALDQLASGEVDRLVVSRLDHLTQDREDLRTLLGSIAERRAGLVILDRDLDTAGLPEPVKPDEVLSHHADPPARPPAAVHTKAVDPHIASMIDEGVSIGEIISALNAEPVPPPQGAQWSFSGVDAARRRHSQPAKVMERTDV